VLVTVLHEEIANILRIVDTTPQFVLLATIVDADLLKKKKKKKKKKNKSQRVLKKDSMSENTRKAPFDFQCILNIASQ